MRDFLASLISFLLIGYVAVCLIEDTHYEISEEWKGYIVVDKTNGYMFGKMLYLLDDSNKVNSVFVYGILYDKYEIGDTIK